VIVIRDTTIPDGMTALELATLIYGPARAARDLIVTIRTEHGGPQPQPPQQSGTVVHATDCAGAVRI
jgi:hypothetical protein